MCYPRELHLASEFRGQFDGYVSELVQCEAKAYLSKSIAKKCKLFRDKKNADSYRLWMNDWSAVKREVRAHGSDSAASRLRPAPFDVSEPCLANMQDGI